MCERAKDPPWDAVLMGSVAGTIVEQRRISSCLPAQVARMLGLIR